MLDTETVQEWLSIRRPGWNAAVDVERFLDFVGKPLSRVLLEHVQAFGESLLLDGIRGEPQRRILRRVEELLRFTRLGRRAGTCPRCGPYGTLQARTVPSRALTLYVCDECDATWRDLKRYQ